MKNFKHFLTLSIVCAFFAISLTGCGTKKTDSTSGNNNTDKNDLSEDISDAAENAADDVKDAGEDAVDATKDVAEGIGNATDDLLGDGGFDNYNDAHDYFLDTMSSYHSDAKFELRDEDKELNDYQEGSKGYHFYLYDTSKNEKGDRFGEFFVDATSGRIYQKGSDNSISEYPVTSTKVSLNRDSVTKRAGNIKNR